MIHDIGDLKAGNAQKQSRRYAVAGDVDGNRNRRRHKRAVGRGAHAENAGDIEIFESDSEMTGVEKLRGERPGDFSLAVDICGENKAVVERERDGFQSSESSSAVLLRQKAERRSQIGRAFDRRQRGPFDPKSQRLAGVGAAPGN